MKKVVFTNPYDLLFETDKINQLFEDGLELLHVRKPKFSIGELRTFISDIDSKYYNKIVVHQHYSVANEFGLKGIHISKRKRNNWLFRNFHMLFIKSMYSERTISTTFSSVHELKATYLTFDYAFISPLFNSNYTGNSFFCFSKSDVMDMLARKKMPIYGLGGISENRIKLLEEFGFDGVGLQSAVWKSVDPIKSFRNILNKKESEQTVAI